MEKEKQEEKQEKFNFFVMFWEGFKAMKLGRILWVIVIVKLCIMFLILKPFFFPNFLKSRYDSDTEKADYVGSELIRNSEVDTSTMQEESDLLKE